MSSSLDLREALTQRLKRLEATSSVRSSSVSSLTGGSRGSGGILGGPTLSSGNSTMTKGIAGGAQDNRRSMSLPGVAQLSFSREPSVSPTAAPALPRIRCEGHLSKYSSGSLTGRWQKRYFLLENGRLGYFKKPPGPDMRGVEPDKSFSLRKVKEVVWNESAVNEREFSIKFGDSQSYQLKAPSPAEMRKWVSALSTALAQKDSIPQSDDDDMGGSSSAVDLVSVSNSVSSQASDSTVMNEDIQAYLQQQRQMVQASSAARKQDTVWEVEIDPDELDRLFSEWFSVTSEHDDDDIKKRSHLVMKSILIASSHLYATVGSEPFDAQVLDLKNQLKRARSTIQSLRKSEAIDPIRNQLNSIVMEYISRIVNEVVKFLDHRKDLRDSIGDLGSVENELVCIIDTLCQLMTDLSTLTVTKTDCSCACCSPSEGAGESCSATDRWKKTLRNILQRLGSELEVTIIERIQEEILTWESTWDAEAGSCPTAPIKASHVLFGTRLVVWLSGWSTSLVSSCEKEGFGLVKDEAKIRHCRRFMSELVASVLVAVLNSAWRQFKRRTVRSQQFAQVWKDTLRQIAYLKETNTGFWSVFSNQHHEIERLENSVPLEEAYTLDLTNLVAFGNEAILLSTFLSETLPEQLAFVPRIFQSCFEGLAATFTNTAAEVASLIVQFHFVEKFSPEICACFKTLQSAAKRTPMIIARDATEKFTSELIPFGTHPALKTHVVNNLPSALIQLYVTALLKFKPKLKETSILETDLIIFKSLFSESRFNCKDSVVHKAMVPLQVVVAFLSERNKQNVIDELSKKVSVAFGHKFAPQAASVLIEIRGNDFSKSERACLLGLLDGSTEVRDSKPPLASLSRTETASYLGDSADPVWRL